MACKSICCAMAEGLRQSKKLVVSVVPNKINIEHSS